MSESAKYDAYKKKLQGVCDENDLTYRFRPDTYPITLTIKPVSGVDSQMTMLEFAEEKGYTSPNAAIVFAYKDGAITYKTSDTFTISEALFSKIKNLFKNMYFMWLQYFFRDILERRILTEQAFPKISEDSTAADEELDEPGNMEITDDAELPDDDDDSYKYDKLEVESDD